MLAIRRSIRIVLPRAGLAGGLLLLACASAAAQATGADRDARGALPPHATHLDHRLGEIERLLAGAHFHTALAVARDTLEGLPAGAGGPDLAARRARLEVMRATAEIALDRRAEAHRSMARALRHDPDLVLDERTTSPKVRALLRRARQGPAAPEPAP